jgi:hypothetical protein
MKQSTD